MPHRILVRYALGAGMAATTLTSIVTGLTDPIRMIGTLSLGASVVMAVCSYVGAKARQVNDRVTRLNARLTRQTEQGGQQARQLRILAHDLYRGNDDTGPHPLRRVK